MTFKSLPLTVREVKATEAVLERIYNGARLGLRNESLALAAGLLPAEFNRLRQLDPLAEIAEQKGRADAEAALSNKLHEAAMNGDAKAALEILKHQHAWVAKQQVQVDVTQQISITAALEAAQRRVESATQYVEEVPVARAQVLGGSRASADDEAVEPADRQRPRSVRDVRIPVGGAEHASG